MAAPGLKNIYIREIDGQKRLVFKGSKKYVFTISTLTDEGDIGPQYAHRRGGHLFKLNGKNLEIYRESTFEDDEAGNDASGAGVWDSRGEIDYFDNDDVFVAALFSTEDLDSYIGDNQNEAYDRLVAHIQSHCALGGGRRRKTRRTRRRRN
jgi:hypothetical protein